MNITGISAWCYIDFGSTSSNPTCYGAKLLLNGTEVKDIVIPQGITEIKKYAFYSYRNMTSVTIPNSVASIGESAFDGCSGISSLSLPNSVKNIGVNAFRNCSGLSSVTINGDLSNVDLSNADNVNIFEGCNQVESLTYGEGCTYAWETKLSGISSVTFSNTVTRLASKFYYYKNLKEVRINTRKTELQLPSRVFEGCPIETLYLGGKIKYSDAPTTEDSPFHNNPYLAAVYIEDGETNIYEGEFRGCTALTYVSIGNGVREIGKYAFYGCKTLQRLDIGSGLSAVGDYAFVNCTALSKFVCEAKVPPTCSENAFALFNKSNCNLYVNRSYINAYKNAEQWKDFLAILDINNVDVDPSAKITVVCESSDKTRGTVTGGGTYRRGDRVELVATAANGYRFKQWSDGVIDNPYVFYAVDDVTLKAFFTVLYTINVESSNEDMGSVSGSGVYEEGAQVTLTATPNYGNEFVRWSDGSTANPYTFSAKENKQVTAEFQSLWSNYCIASIKKVTVLKPNQWYFITQSRGGESPAYEDENLLRVMRAPRDFQIQKGDIFGDVRPYLLQLQSISGPGAYKIRWASGNYWASTSETNYGVAGIAVRTVKSEQQAGEYYIYLIDGNQPGHFGINLITAYAPHGFIVDNNGAGYNVSYWGTGEVTTTGGNNDWSFYEVELSAFVPPVSILATCDASQGSVSGSGAYPKGEQVTLTATPASGYRFLRWSNGSTQNPYKFTATENLTLTAQFEKLIVISATSESGFIGSVTGSGRYNKGAQVTLTATPEEGFAFDHWSDGSTKNPYTFTATVDKEITAHFRITDNRKVESITKANSVKPNQWYIITQNRLGESPAFDYYISEEKEVRRAPKDYSINVGDYYVSARPCLLKLVSTSTQGVYKIRWASGNYWFTTSETEYGVGGITVCTVVNKSQAGNYFIYPINGQQGHFGMNLTTDNRTYGLIVDNNGAGSTVSLWGTGKVTTTGGNNDWTFYEVELTGDIPTSIESVETEKEDGLLFDLQGRMTTNDNNLHGVFIRNGRKYMKR